jgi:D-serine deaminase-like pyridoxal phosphate-dependent protein
MNDLHELPTPCLVIDVARVRHNAERMSARIAAFGACLRPHVKTHKCVEVARLATAGHNGAITASTLAEARAFAAHGFTDITYAVPIEPGKFAAALDLIKSGVQLGLITDEAEVVTRLNDAAQHAGVTVPLWLDVDIGYHRCGVEPHTPEAFVVPQRIADASHLQFAGIITHAGHSYHAQSAEELRAIARHERDAMKDFAAQLRTAGLDVPALSIGSTPTASVIDALDGVDEVRPGNYVFYDAFQATLGSCSFADCALTVLAAVTHRDRARRRVVIDAGAIALSKDRGPVEFDSTCGYGRVLDLMGSELGLRVDSLSQEHGILQVEDEATFDKLKVGARVRILANHSCLAAAQHTHYHILENDRIVDRWEIHRGW